MTRLHLLAAREFGAYSPRPNGRRGVTLKPILEEMRRVAYSSLRTYFGPLTWAWRRLAWYFGPVSGRRPEAAPAPVRSKD